MTTLVQVDVFGDAVLAGNPLAVFVNAPELPTARYQAWAREMNLSETVFLWPKADRQRYRCRIFTPFRELPFAGHPTIGAAWTLSWLGLIGEEALQETEAGLTTVQVQADGMTWLTPPTGVLGARVPAAEAAEALGIPTLWVSEERPPQIASAGLPHLLVHLDIDEIASVRPPMDRMRQVLDQWGAGGLLVWAFEPGGNRVHARGFAPGYGVDEDPATGSAAAALGVYLKEAAGVTHRVTYTMHQGREIGRPSTLHIELGRPGAGLRVGGRVVPVFKTMLEEM
jgi:trans-2,3-dihydro-3-hydroxyanthranilate isomerase